MDRSEWEHLIPEIERDIDSVRIVCVQLSRAGEISLTERLGNYTVVKTLKPDSPYYFALLEVVGPLEPGDSRDFVKIDPAEETFTAEMVEEVLLGTDIFERLEVDRMVVSVFFPMANQFPWNSAQVHNSEK